MIRGNYSLAKEVRKNEQKSKQKIQQRQKHQSQLQQLSSIDPIKLFFQIERLEKVSGLDQFQQKKLQKLRQDWAFIIKNKLHEEKVKTFLSKREQAKEAKEKEQRKLRGKDSVYFNPELNPLGKVPNANNVEGKYGTFMNIAKPVKSIHVYKADPLIREFNIKPPQGSPPRFYKNVQNTQRDSNNVPSSDKAIQINTKERTKYETSDKGIKFDIANLDNGTTYNTANLDTDSEGQSDSDN